MIRRPIFTPDAPKPGEGLYSQGIVLDMPYGKIIHTAGQVALRPDLTFAGGPITVQTHQVMKNLGAILAAEGAGFEHVAQARIYLTDMAEYGDVNDVYASYFEQEPPARECVEVSALPLRGAHIEMSMVAYL